MSGARRATASASADFPTAVVPTNATCRDGRGARGAVPGAIADGRYPAVHGLGLFGGVTGAYPRLQAAHYHHHQEVAMEAHIGDHVVVEGTKVGQPQRRGEVLEILRGAGGDRLRVRWQGTGHETVLVPGPDMSIESGGGAQGGPAPVRGDAWPRAG